MASSPGTLLSQRYEIRELIGTDGAVEVYRALDLRLGRDVALTVLEVHNLAGTEEYLRFERESQARAAMQHPRIATIHDFGHDATRIFLVAEWMEGESLRSRLSRGFLDLPQVRTLGRELLDGLTEIHGKGFALGSLSTASAFLEKDGHGKLFAYRLQKIGNGSAEGFHQSKDLRSLAALLLFSLPPPGERPRMARPDTRVLEQLAAWSASEDPVEVPTAQAFREILQGGQPRAWKRRLPWIAALGVLLAGGVALLYVRHLPPQPRLTVALLPFQNLDRKPETDYLGPNLLHTLARNLGHEPDVRVALTGSSPVSPGDPVTTARCMGADLSLSGSYRIQNGQLFVEVLLHRTRDGSLLSRCEVEHPLTELLFLSSELEDHIRASLQGGSPAAKPLGSISQNSQDPEAQRLCLQGIQLLGNMDPAGFEKALKCFQAATTRDPAFALAYSGLSDCYCLLGSRGMHPRKEAQQLAEGFARRALDLDPGLAQAHASLANVRFRFGLDWVGAEAEFRQAIRLDSTYARGHQWFGIFLATLGHWEESLEHMRRALELEPLSISCRTHYALDLHWAGRSDEAAQEFDKILDQDPSCIGALTTLWQIQEEREKLPEALATAERLVSLGALTEKSFASIRDALEAQGPKGYWEQRVRQVEQARDGDAMRLAEVVALQGDRDRAFRLLDRALQEQSPFMIYVPKDPAFEALRQDPRFSQLLKRMGYPST